MFARIMAVVLAVILLTTLGLSAVWWITLRDQQIDARLEYLISEAQEIAFLAGNLNGSSLMDTIRDRDSVTRSYLNRMAEKVNREFGAFIAVIDRGGHVMTYDTLTYNADPDTMENLNEEEILIAFNSTLKGETIRLRSEIDSAPTFTVGGGRAGPVGRGGIPVCAQTHEAAARAGGCRGGDRGGRFFRAGGRKARRSGAAGAEQDIQHHDQKTAGRGGRPQGIRVEREP